MTAKPRYMKQWIFFFNQLKAPYILFGWKHLDSNCFDYYLKLGENYLSVRYYNNDMSDLILISLVTQESPRICFPDACTE